jgi:putative tricarboxylic transport membrane protein
MKRNDRIAGMIFIALGVFILTQTYSYPSLEKGHPGPGLFPNLLAILFMVFGGVLVARSRRLDPSVASIEKPPKPTVERIANACSVLGLIVLFVVAVDHVGFLITSALLLFLLMKRLGVSLLRSAASSILITLFINLMFAKLLRVPLPPGILSW